MPRSPSRDVVDRFNTNQGGRLRYFQRWNPLERRKMLLSIAALVIAVGWLGASWLTKAFEYQSTHGPLAMNHARWDAQCEQCHRVVDAGPFDAHAKWSTSIETCGRCHGGAVHSAKIKPGDASENCGSCHHDHNGRDFSLVKLSDNHCVRCHENLKLNSTGDVKYMNEITSFAKHPEFLDKPRPSTLKFSHAQHMTPGMVIAEGGKPVSGGRQPPGLGENAQGADAPRSLVLQCVDCHNLDKAGEYYEPVKYENHCAKCHPTMAGPVVTDAKSVIPVFNVPHGMPLAKLRDLIQSEVTAKLLNDQPELSKEFQTGRAATAEMKTFVASTKSKADGAFKTTMDTNCGKCHGIGEKGLEGRDRSDELGGYFISPVQSPKIWLPHSRFNHTAHRSMKCDDCHPGTGAAFKTPENAKDWEREPPHFVKDARASCASCHSPAGGVRHACTDCHSYHHGDSAPDKKLTIEQFLKGP